MLYGVGIVSVIVVAADADDRIVSTMMLLLLWLWSEWPPRISRWIQDGQLVWQHSYMAVEHDRLPTDAATRANWRGCSFDVDNVDDDDDDDDDVDDVVVVVEVVSTLHSCWLLLVQTPWWCNTWD